ncbi:sugar transport protein 13 [Tanacetum coccineum]
MEKEDPADVTKSLANDFNDLIAKLSSDVPVTNGPTGWDDLKVNVHGTKKVGTSCGSDKGSGVVDQNDDVVTTTVKANSTPSFVKVLQGNPIKTVVKIQELRNSEVVDGAVVVILIEAVEETSNTILKKDEIKSTSLWVKLHHVPIVAYSQVGLSLITMQLGRPIMLDSYTSNMCLSLWGRNTYARALIDISTEEELKESFVIAIPLSNGKGHTLATIDIKYEWTPSRCATCRVFDHVDDKCPKRPKVDVLTKDMDDGFTMVMKKKAKAKQNQKTRHVEGVRLSKPALNLQYRRVEKEETSKNNETMVNGNVNVTKVSPAVTVQNDHILKKPFTLMDDNVVLKNTFSALTDDEDAGPDTCTILNEDSECEAIDEELIMEGLTSDPNIEGASTPVEKVVNV